MLIVLYVVNSTCCNIGHIVKADLYTHKAFGGWWQNKLLCIFLLAAPFLIHQFYLHEFYLSIQQASTHSTQAASSACATPFNFTNLHNPSVLGSNVLLIPDSRKFSFSRQFFLLPFSTYNYVLFMTVLMFKFPFQIINSHETL